MAKLEADMALLQEATAPPRGAQPGADHAESAGNWLRANRYCVPLLANGGRHPSLCALTFSAVLTIVNMYYYLSTAFTIRTRFRG